MESFRTPGSNVDSNAIVTVRGEKSEEESFV